jgi:TetR/AcrR family transcriptional regulator, regulator of mycofactocin system
LTNRSRPRGRPSVTSRQDIEQCALTLFQTHGYAETTILMIAEAAGVSRTSFFRYYGSKSELIWAPFDEHTAQLRTLLSQGSITMSTMDVVRQGVVGAMRFSIDPAGTWVQRFAVMDSSVDLSAQLSAHWDGWATAIAEYVAARTGASPADLVPRAVGGAMQAAFIALLRGWLTVSEPGFAVLDEMDARLIPLCDALQKLVAES